VNHCDASLEDELMKELDKPNNEISKTLMHQLKAIAGNLRESFKNKHQDKIDNQWLVATPLNIAKEKSGQLKLEEQKLDTKHIYFNFKKADMKKDFCDHECVEKIERLSTTIKRDKRKLENWHMIHTEIQMLYRNEADNILHDEANKNKVILIYSKYIPCSQNQNSQGGTFVECAGELANYITKPNPNKNKLIVFYETQHTAESINGDSVDVSSVVGVSRLYMEMSGIVAFKYTPNNKRLVRDPLYINRAAYFRKHPMSSAIITRQLLFRCLSTV